MIKKMLVFSFVLMLWAGACGNAWAQYLGGSGTGDALGRYTMQDVVYIGSAAQTFTLGQAPGAITAIQIYQDLAATGGGISAANDIRVKIPARLDMTWDPSVTTATRAGSASGKVSATVSFANSNKTLVIDVTSPFADGEAVVISGLNFANFNTAVADALTLETDNNGMNDAADPAIESIVMAGISGNTYGGNGDGYADAGFADHVYGYTGGTGKGDAAFLFGSGAVMALASAADQTFTTSDAPTSASAVTITQNYAPAGQGVQAAKGIRVKIPSALGMTWNTALTSASVAGTAAGKVSWTVSYENGGKTLLITVNSNFVDGDTITVSGLAFNNFTSSGLTWLGLEIANDGTTLESDPFYKQIFALTRTRGFTGGAGKGDALLIFRYDATGAVSFSTLF